MTAPHERNGWRLVTAGNLVPLWSDCGKISLENGTEWTIGRSEVSLHVILFTDLPHPDDPTETCIYMRNCEQDIAALAEGLTGSAPA
ncbi:hypothetical protein [Mameliella alba]|uniref:Uncharacterized protein n=1 Tax=Mameliella alba TaxID=561184 RepID=A0A0B3SI99_9RHOB|nr:hypothetical protein [Mameliella alba]KHQ50309.1 hypothetical protein OA50_05157 [Mameliella alba]